MMKKFLLMVVFLFMTQNASFAQWWSVEGEMPHPVAGGEAVVINDQIFIIGGYSDSTQANVAWIQKYDPDSDSWEIVGDMLHPRFGFSAGVSNNNIVVFGGLEDTTDIVNSMEVWNNANYSEVLSTYINPVFNRIFPAGIVDNDKFYIFGGNPYPGIDNSLFNYISVYNLTDSSIVFESDSTLFGDEIPEQQMALQLGNQIHLFGGVFFGISQNIYQFNTENNTFFESPTKLMQPRANGEAVEVNSEIYLIGGYNESVPALASVEALIPADSIYYFQYVPELIYPRRNLMAVNHKDKIYVFGGFDENGNVVSEIEVYDPMAVVGVEDEAAVFNEMKVYQNYPNPFNPVTKIKFEIPSNGSHYGKHVQLKVFDVLGNEVETLLDEEKSPGTHEVKFDAAKYASGIYFYQLKSEFNIFTKKMIVVK